MKTALALLLLLSVAPVQKIAAQNLTSNIPYAKPAHKRQVLDIYTPEGAKNLPVVFWIHGGGWVTGDKTSVQIKPRVVCQRGFVFVSTNYRLLPDVEMGVLIRDVAKSLGSIHPSGRKSICHRLLWRILCGTLTPFVELPEKIDGFGQKDSLTYREITI